MALMETADNAQKQQIFWATERAGVPAACALQSIFLENIAHWAPSGPVFAVPEHLKAGTFVRVVGRVSPSDPWPVSNSLQTATLT